jgi:hypothetical protein
VCVRSVYVVQCNSEKHAFEDGTSSKRRIMMVKSYNIIGKNGSTEIELSSKKNN